MAQLRGRRVVAEYVFQCIRCKKRKIRTEHVSDIPPMICHDCEEFLKTIYVASKAVSAAELLDKE